MALSWGSPPSWGLTVGAQQALKLGQKADGVELPQEATIVQAVPQLDDKATDEGCQLWREQDDGVKSGPFSPCSSPFFPHY